MQFQQAQLRETIGISVETFRHWKRVLPPFSRRPRAAKYDLGELLAAAIFQRLTSECGLRTGALASIAEAIARICATHTWARLERSTLIVDPRDGTCELRPREGSFSPSSIVIVCPLDLVVAHVRAALSKTNPAEAQHALAFGPAAVTDVRPGRRRPA